jgi:hypothetical protein
MMKKKVVVVVVVSLLLPWLLAPAMFALVVAAVRAWNTDSLITALVFVGTLAPSSYFQWSFLVNVLVFLSEAESETDLLCPDCSVVVIFVQFCLWLLGSQLNEAAARMRFRSLCLLHLSLLQLLPRLAGLTSPFCVLVVTTNCCSSSSKGPQINSSLGNYNFVTFFQ